MRAKIPDCELISYEGLPHNICDIVPDRCAADILAFLRTAVRHETVRHRPGDSQQERRAATADAGSDVRHGCRLSACGAITGAERRAIGALYGLPADDVTVIPYPVGRAIKIVLARPIMAGDPGDRDVYGAQQHAPLLGMEI